MWHLQSRTLFAAAVLAATVAAAAPASGELIYSLETLYSGNPPVADPAGIRPDGFHPNGGGTQVTRDAAGATEGSFGMKFTQVALATFTGAQTELLAGIGTINSADFGSVSLDLTVPTDAGGRFTGTFARLGITEFGNNEPQGIAGGQAQTTAEAEQNIDLAPGRYHLTIPLIARQNPITFEGPMPFSAIFGPSPDNQLTPSSFQFYINKSADGALAVYIDNVRAVKATQTTFGDANEDGLVNAADLAILTASYAGGETAARKTWQEGDFNLDGKISSDDFALFNLGVAIGVPPPSGAAVPEPVTAALLGLAAVGLAVRRRR